MAEPFNLPTIEKGDVIATKDGRSVRVLSVYKPDGIIRKVDAVDDGAESPIREVIFSKDIARILVKRKKPEEQKQAALPPEQAVKEKVPVSEDLKKDVESRDRETTSSARAKGAAK